MVRSGRRPQQISIVGKKQVGIEIDGDGGRAEVWSFWRILDGIVLLWNENDQNEEVEIRIGDHILRPMESFRYLGYVIHKSGRIEDDGGDSTGYVVRVRVLAVNRMEVAEMRMLMWTCGRTILDMIPNGAFRRNHQVTTVVNKMREGRLRWFGHVKRRPHATPVRRVESITVEGLRRRGRPKLRWEDKLKTDLKELPMS
ncbi:hypothetical protein Tco_0603638 [Tanacetum coccineum]